MKKRKWISMLLWCNMCNHIWVALFPTISSEYRQKCTACGCYDSEPVKEKR